MSCNEISALFSTNNKHAITWYNSQIIIYKNIYNIVEGYIYNKLRRRKFDSKDCILEDLISLK